MPQEKLIIDAGECAYEALSYACVLIFCDKQGTQIWARHHIQSECADLGYEAVRKNYHTGSTCTLHRSKKALSVAL